MCWDSVGVIKNVDYRGVRWSYDVTMTDDRGRPHDTPTLHSDDEIWPDSEETNSVAAKEWRAARRLKVFLCHGSEDKQPVRDLYKQLFNVGMKPWLDEKDLEPGSEWDTAIQDAVRDCQVVLVCLSETSIGKTGYVQKEIKFALDRADEKPEGTTYIIPVKLEDCPVPKRLQKWQWVNLYDADGIERLLRVLRKLAMTLKLY
jgi:TIR domain